MCSGRSSRPQLYFWSCCALAASTWKEAGTRFQAPLQENTLESCFRDLSSGCSGLHTLDSLCYTEHKDGWQTPRFSMHGTFNGSWLTPTSCLWRQGIHHTPPAKQNYNGGVPCTTRMLSVHCGQTRVTRHVWDWFSCTAWTRRRPPLPWPCLGRHGRWWRFRRPLAPRKCRSRRRFRSQRGKFGWAGLGSECICRICDETWATVMQSMCPLHVFVFLFRLVRWHCLLCCILCLHLTAGAQSGSDCQALGRRPQWKSMSTGPRASDDEVELLSELMSEGPSPDLDPSAPPAGPPPPRPEQQHQFSIEVSHAVASVLLRYVDWTGRVLTRIRGDIARAAGITIEVRSMAWHEEVHRDITRRGGHGVCGD